MRRAENAHQQDVSTKWRQRSDDTRSVLVMNVCVVVQQCGSHGQPVGWPTKCVRYLVVRHGGEKLEVQLPRLRIYGILAHNYNHVALRAALVASRNTHHRL